MSSNRFSTAHGCSWTSRLYENEHDLRQMQGLLMDARSHTSDWRFAHVGEFLFGFFMVACHLNPQETIRLWHDQQGKLVGYAILSEDPTFECQVLPEYEGPGIEDAAQANHPPPSLTLFGPTGARLRWRFG